MSELTKRPKPKLKQSTMAWWLLSFIILPPFVGVAYSVATNDTANFSLADHINLIAEGVRLGSIIHGIMFGLSGLVLYLLGIYISQAGESRFIPLATTSFGSVLLSSAILSFTFIYEVPLASSLFTTLHGRLLLSLLVMIGLFLLSCLVIVLRSSNKGD